MAWASTGQQRLQPAPLPASLNSAIIRFSSQPAMLIRCARDGPHPLPPLPCHALLAACLPASLPARGPHRFACLCSPPLASSQPPPFSAVPAVPMPCALYLSLIVAPTPCISGPLHCLRRPPPSPALAFAFCFPAWAPFAPVPPIPSPILLCPHRHTHTRGYAQTTTPSNGHHPTPAPTTNNKTGPERQGRLRNILCSRNRLSLERLVFSLLPPRACTPATAARRASLPLRPLPFPEQELHDTTQDQALLASLFSFSSCFLASRPRIPVAQRRIGSPAAAGAFQGGKPPAARRQAKQERQARSGVRRAACGVRRAAAVTKGRRADPSCG